MQLYQDQSPAAVTRIVLASQHDTLSVLDYKNKNALHPPAVIIVHQAFHSKVIHSQTSLPSHVPSTRFPTGTALVLLTPVRFNRGLRRSRFTIPITGGRPLLEPPVLVTYFILRVTVADDTRHVLWLLDLGSNQGQLD